jgi:hypothetical protein
MDNGIRQPNQDNRTRYKNIRRGSDYSKRSRDVLKKVKEIFNDNGVKFQKGDEINIITKPTQKPDFPYLIILTAIIKDIIDFPAEISVIGIILTTFLSIVLSIILFFWVLGKASGGWWKRRIIGWIWLRYFTITILEFIPFLKMIPAATIFILMVHNKENKIVKLANLALEEFRGAGMMRRIR